MDKYILSGIIYCGNCGTKMIGVCEGKKGNWYPALSNGLNAKELLYESIENPEASFYESSIFCFCSFILLFRIPHSPFRIPKSLNFSIPKLMLISSPPPAAVCFAPLDWQRFPRFWDV